MIIRSMNNEKEFPEGTTVKACLEALGAFPRGTLAAQSGGVVCELNDVLRQDCTLVPLTLENEEGRRIYERSLRFVMLLALRHLYPYQRVRIEYSVGYGVFVRLPGVELHRQDIVRIEDEMRRLNFSEEMINEATGYAETDDEEILAAREKYRELIDKYKAEIEVEAEKVREAGGLFIMGTTRHESRRIDNQLRGRSGRQGDPGASRFYLSADDDILRLFAGDRIKNIMNKMPGEDSEPLESKLLTSVIESAQSKVEGRNFSIRKSVLEYDDVMNRQREIIYSQRDQVLDGENLRETIIKMLTETMESMVEEYLPHDDKDNWNLEGLRDALKGWLLDEDDEETFVYDEDELERLEKEYLIGELSEKAVAEYEKNEELIPEETMRELERVYLLKNVDKYWMDHIDAMDELKRGIRLRSYGQHDPVVEYRIEGFDMFDDMIRCIREDTVKMLMVVPKKVAQRLEEQEKMREMASRRGAMSRARAAAIAAANNQTPEEVVIEISQEDDAAQEEIPEITLTPEVVPEKEEENISQDDIRKAAGKFMEREQVAKPTSTNMDSSSEAVNKTVRGVKKIGRNDPCPCGSGKKYKKCCGANK